MFDRVKSFFGSVGQFFKSIPTKIYNGVSTIVNIPSRIVNTLHDDAKSVLKTVNDTVLHVIDKGSDTTKHIVDGATNVITKGQKVIGDTVSNTASSLSMPLMLIGGAGAFYLLTMKK